ncbi:MAG: hypothetical protein HYT89_03690 [Candidatus Omnitrophica bacterium]|nr:hypothetical protein [Candidatus Kaiserbacteria bacterium]MBI2095250.1 hypothetical protein [Candidatus Omnitrophota bacterium]
MAAQKLPLGEHVRMVMLQFNSSKPTFIPRGLMDWLIEMGRETPEKRAARKSYPVAGIPVIEPTLQCSLREMPAALETAGYELADVLHEERLDGKDPAGKRTYHMIRFVFVRREVAEVSDDFKAVRNMARDGLRHICESAFWRVRSFLNPFYQDGEAIEGLNAASVNMEVRVPLLQPNGVPITARLKNQWGKAVGDPLPLRPDFFLRIVDNTVSLIEA